MISEDDLVKIIPQTFGEAILIFPWIKCEPHEWDNRTTEENLRWIINQLPISQPAYEDGQAEE